MKKFKLLAAMAAFFVLMTVIVIFASPYAPSVALCRDVEELWAIEDARQESEKPLVTALENNGVPLGYDAQSNTFYCNLGLENGEEWPQLHLTAPGAKGVELCFVDDYTYDFCSDAVAQGYAYELFAYTDTEYSYFNIVFTGLPIIVVHSKEKIDREDEDAVCTVADADAERSIVKASARVHLRGDGTYRYVIKKSYKIEFTRGARSKTAVDVPGIGKTEDLNLLSMSLDESYMRDRLSWDMLSHVLPDKEVFSARPTAYAEVFVNDEYQGVYVMSTPFELEEELTRENKEGLYWDSLYRTTSLVAIKDKPILEASDGAPYEMQYSSDTKDTFAGLETYLQLREETDDEAFAELVKESIDLDSILTYTVLLQGMALADNSTKNMYIWQHWENGQFRYRFELWDMDRSWDLDPGPMGDYWYANKVHDRVLELDINGARVRFEEIWQQMRARGMNVETVTDMVMRYEHELEDSGAFNREIEKWDKPEAYLNPDRIITCAQMRFDWMDQMSVHIARTDGTIPFLDVGAREEAFFYPTYEYLSGFAE